MARVTDPEGRAGAGERRLLAWLDGAWASGAARVSSRTPLLPGADIAFTRNGDGVAVQASLGYLFVIAFLLTFVLAARPWRLARRRPDCARPV
jgi:hypothetical protein